jgi:plastocyanin
MLKPGINLKLGLPLLIVVFVSASLALYGGAQLVKQDEVAADGEVVDGGGPSPGPGPVSVTIVAQNIAFDLDRLVANAGSEFNVTLDNQDAGVPHNVSFYTDRSAGQAIFVGELLTGPGTQTETFTAPASSGNYFFRCDVHPDQMTGTFIVQ